MVAPMVAARGRHRASIGFAHRRASPSSSVTRASGRRCMLHRISVAVAGRGIGVGWWVYGRRSVVVNTRVCKERFGFVYDALAQKLYFDLDLRVPLHQAATSYSAEHARDLRQRASSTASSTASRAGGSSRARRAGASTAASSTVPSTASRRSRGARAPTCASCRSGRLQSYQRLVLSALVALMLCLVIYVVVKGAYAC